MVERITHLVEDAAAGGVMRFLEYLKSDVVLNAGHRHVVRVVSRRALSAEAMDADVIVSHLGLCWAMLPMLTPLRARNPGARLVHVEHSYTPRLLALSGGASARFDAMLASAYAVFDVIVAVSRPQAEWIVKREYACERRVQIVNPCVSLDRLLKLAPVLGRPPSVFGAIGRHDVQKGFDVAIEAFLRAAQPHQQLLLFGDGPERRRLQRLAGGDPRIEFRGWAEDPVDAYAACDAILAPSRYEAFGLVALEAQSAGRLVIASGADGLSEHAAHGAMLVGSHSIEDWSDALVDASSRRHDRDVMLGLKRSLAAERQFRRRWLSVVADIAVDIGVDAADLAA